MKLNARVVQQSNGGPGKLIVAKSSTLRPIEQPVIMATTNARLQRKNSRHKAGIEQASAMPRGRILKTIASNSLDEGDSGFTTFYQPDDHQTVASDGSKESKQPQVTLAFISKVFRVDPKILRDKIKETEEKIQKDVAGKERAIKDDPNMKIIFDYLSTC